MRQQTELYGSGAPTIFVNSILADNELLEEYQSFLLEDPEIEKEAIEAARAMRNRPLDDLDYRTADISRAKSAALGTVGRRAPPNPFHSPKLGRFKTKTPGGGTAKVADPALRDNPLIGRLFITISVNSALFLVYCQSLIFNFTSEGRFYAPSGQNSNLGPSGTSLFKLGGLNANQIRAGESVRLYWSMCMHSGWLHILANVLCQAQYMYMVEPDWGALRTVGLFYVSALTGNLFSVILDPCKTTVGSSGGLFGLMGGVVPYCIEFWYSIPRPTCILVFSIIVAVVSLLTGLTKSTDAWAHLGGLWGGLLFGFATITSPNAFLDRERAAKKRLRRNAWMRWLQQTINPECKCGIREWSLRLSAIALLAVTWGLCYGFLYSNYEYKPPGSVTFSGITDCVCCYDLITNPGDRSRGNWVCNPAETLWYGMRFRDFCDQQMESTRILKDLKSGTIAYDEDLFSSLDRAISNLQPPP